MLKGNHDYWWNTVKKMKRYLDENNFSNIDFLYNNSYIYENRIICGTRGWAQGETAEDKKMIRRENMRLEMSLAEGRKNYGEDKEIIVCMHYPPFNEYEEPDLNLISTMNKYNATKCIYGHIHGQAHTDAIEGQIKGIEFKLVSSDYIDFKLVQV